MDAKKVDYPKKHLAQALNEENYGDINYCFQELSNIPNIDISEFAKDVDEFNKKYRFKANKNASSDFENLKDQMCQLNAKKKIANKIGWRCFFCGLVTCFPFGFIVELIFEKVLHHYAEWSAFFVTVGLEIILMFVGIIFIVIQGEIGKKIVNIRRLIFNELCFSQEKFKYLDNIDVLNDITGNCSKITVNCYKGQIVKGKQEGFGIYLDSNGYFYIGEWHDGEMSGIGKLMTDDFRMVMEGEFLSNRANGIVDITWDDGSEWHGEYKQGSPWNGQGKAILPWHRNKVLEGNWVNGVRLK